MIVPSFLFLLQAPAKAPTPAPTPAFSVGRSTPVPAGGSLRDLAMRRRGFSPEEGMKGTFSVASEGSNGPIRHENLRARAVPDGLLVEGELVNDETSGGEWIALEIYAMRRDGKITRGILGTEGRGPTVFAGKRRPFSRMFVAPANSADPANLRPETVKARIHLRPDMSTFRIEGQEYIKRIACLTYWGKPVPNPKAAAKEDEQVEVHVMNACSWPVRADDSWFVVRTRGIYNDESQDQRVYGLFVEDVPPKGELQQVIPARVERGGRLRVVPWRLKDD